MAMSSACKRAFQSIPILFRIVLPAIIGRMRQRPFGRLRARVSEVGLGCWQLGGADWGDVTDEQALATLAAAADAGVTLFDTADVYGLGRSESLIGRFLKSRKAEHGKEHLF